MKFIKNVYYQTGEPKGKIVEAKLPHLMSKDEWEVIRDIIEKEFKDKK